MSNRSDARRWFLLEHGESKNKIFTSKYYTPEESWPKKAVWWLHISDAALDSDSYSHVIIICQAAPEKNDYYYLRVPVEFFKKHSDNFHRIHGKINIYLSAEPKNFLTEIRGTGNLNFSEFLVLNDSV